MTKRIKFGFTVDDVGYDGYSTEEHLNNVLDYCDELGLKATLFAVPIVEGKKLNHRKGYISILRDAIKRGHEIAQHGLTHDRFEVGIPPGMILDLPHEKATKKYLEDNREAIEKSHSVKNICETLRMGRGIIEDTIGQQVEGFRAPALQICENLFKALEEDGYRYDSSIFLQKRAWDILNGEDSEPTEITREIFDGSQRSESMFELPLTAEYTWYLEEDKFDEFLALIIHDVQGCIDSGIPFVNVSHVSPIQEGDGKSGFNLYRSLLSYLKENEIELQSFTLSELTQQINY